MIELKKVKENLHVFMNGDKVVPIWFEQIPENSFKQYEKIKEEKNSIGILAYSISMERVSTTKKLISELELNDELVKAEEFYTLVLDDFMALATLLQRMNKYNLDTEKEAMVVKII